MAEDEFKDASVEDLTALEDLPLKSDKGADVPSDDSQQTTEGQSQSQQEEPEKGGTEKETGTQKSQEETTSEEAEAKTEETTGESKEPTAEGEGSQEAPEGKTGEETVKDTQETITPEQRDKLVSEMTSGKIVKVSDVTAVLEDYERLLDLEKNPEKLLENHPRAAALWKFVKTQPGEDVAADSQRYYQIMALDTEKMSAKQSQFEAYMLEPENRDLSREDGKALFDKKYEKLYGEDVKLDELKEEDPLLYREHQVATNQAKESIDKLKSEFKSETTETTEESWTQEEQDEFDQGIAETLKEFEGISIAFDPDAKDEDKVNFQLDSDGKKEFAHYLNNPGEWWKDQLAGFLDDKTEKFDHKGFRNFMMLRMFPEQLLNIAHKQGFERGKIWTQQDAKNASTEEIKETPAPEGEKFVEAFENALEGK